MKQVKFGFEGIGSVVRPTLSGYSASILCYLALEKREETTLKIHYPMLADSLHVYQIFYRIRYSQTITIKEWLLSPHFSHHSLTTILVTFLTWMPLFISFSGKDKSDEKDTQESLQVCISLTSDLFDITLPILWHFQVLVRDTEICLSPMTWSILRLRPQTWYAYGRSTWHSKQTGPI